MIRLILATAFASCIAQSASAQSWGEYRPTAFTKIDATLADLLNDRWRIVSSWNANRRSYPGNGLILSNGEGWALCELVADHDQYAYTFINAHPKADAISRCFDLTTATPRVQESRSRDIVE